MIASLIKQHRLSGQSGQIFPALILLVITLFGGSTPAWAVGPNLLINYGFEGGDHGYWKANVAPFSISKDPANAHTGTRSLQIKMQPWGSCNTKTPLFVWPNTSYTISIWYKGDGTAQLHILNSKLTAALAHLKFTATSAWQQSSVTFKTADKMNRVQIVIGETDGKGSIVYVDDLYVGLTDAQTIEFDPNHPDGHGMKLLWGDDFKDSSTIDITNMQGNGYHWYLNQFYNLPDTTTKMFSVGEEGLTISDCPVPFGDTLHTATPANNKKGFMGTVFQDTAPLYFESRFRIHNFEKTGTTKGDPAFWTQDVSMGTHIGREMPGHPDHNEMIENDFVEMCHTWGGENGQHISGFGDWTDGGSVGDTCTQYPPVGFDYGQYHTYGCLLVPATAANGWNGYRTIYCDGVPMISNCWIGNQVYQGKFPETRDSMGSYNFSRIDGAWEDLILGTGQGGITPVDWKYVHVYGVSESSVRVVKGAAPATPDKLTAIAADAQVALSWTKTGPSYDVYRGTTAGGENEKPIATGVRTNHYIETGLTNGTTYYYKVVAMNGIGTSEKSMEVSATPAPDGPNVLANPGFENGGTGWSLQMPFTVINVAENAHSGSGELTVTMPAKPSYVNVFQKVDVASHTNYACGLWVKGSGRFQIQVLSQAWNEQVPLAQIDITARDSWQQITLHPFNSGKNGSVHFVIRDRIGTGGMVCLDDCFLHSLAAGK
jgi:hypothetical protein